MNANDKKVLKMVKDVSKVFVLAMAKDESHYFKTTKSEIRRLVAEGAFYDDNMRATVVVSDDHKRTMYVDA